MKKIDIVVTVIVLSIFIGGLIYFTSGNSVAERNPLFEVLSLGVLSSASLFTYFGIRRNTHH